MTSTLNGAPAAGQVVRRFPVHATAPRDIRRYVADLANAARICGDDLATMLLAVHETAANAVEHSGGDTVSVRWEYHEGVVRVAVHDNGVFNTDGRTSDDRGRGLGILLALADKVSVRPGRIADRGTTVRLRFRVRGPDCGHATITPTGPVQPPVETGRQHRKTAGTATEVRGCEFSTSPRRGDDDGEKHSPGSARCGPGS
jgi:anti-sigma regulatory factor (Ser/Thr protein kinase)